MKTESIPEMVTDTVPSVDVNGDGGKEGAAVPPLDGDLAQVDEDDLPRIERLDSVIQRSGVSDDNVAERLDQCLGNVNPLLRDILYDFQSYLTKTLLGSHGQTIVPEGLNSISSESGSSTVSLVMLLCRSRD